MVNGGAQLLPDLQARMDQFERVLRALGSSEEELMHELEGQIASGEQLNHVGSQICERIRASFDARACSLFLDRTARAR